MRAFRAILCLLFAAFVHAQQANGPNRTTPTVSEETGTVNGVAPSPTESTGCVSNSIFSRKPRKVLADQFELLVAKRFVGST